MNGYLLDENLPARLSLPTTFTVRHVCDLGSSLSDSDIWHKAARENLIIVTQDVDFADRMLVSTPPPRVIHIKTGNLKFAQLNEKLGACWPNIEPRLSQCRLVNVYLDRIETVS